MLSTAAALCLLVFLVLKIIKQFIVQWNNADQKASLLELRLKTVYCNVFSNKSKVVIAATVPSGGHN